MCSKHIKIFCWFLNFMPIFCFQGKLVGWFMLQEVGLKKGGEEWAYVE